jgi:hypothetical protein
MNPLVTGLSRFVGEGGFWVHGFAMFGWFSLRRKETETELAVVVTPQPVAEICQQKEKPGEALFARIEQLIDQVLFNSTVPSQRQVPKS